MDTRASGVGLAVALLLAGACEDEVPLGALVVDSLGVRIAQHQALDTNQPPVATASPTRLRQLGGSDAPADEAIGYVLGQAVVLPGSVLVADVMSRNLRRIELRSGAVSSVGRSGEGPAEYLYPSIVGTLDGDSVVVYDGRLRRVSVLGPTGALARSFDVPSSVGSFVGAVGLLPGGSVVFAGGQGLTLEGRPRVVQDTVPVLVLGPDGALVAEFGSFPARGYFEGPPSIQPRALDIPFMSGALIAAGPSGVFVGSPDEFEIRRFDRSGALLGILRVSVPPAPIPQHELDSIIDAEAEASRLPEGVRALFRLMPIPALKPPFAQLVIDSAGNLWVQANSASLSERAWLVFDERGSFMGHAELPPGRVLYLGGGLVITLTYDQFGAQVVSVFELRGDVFARRAGRQS